MFSTKNKLFKQDQTSLDYNKDGEYFKITKKRFK